ncbi:MAG: DUF456 domain-containing protein [Rikenellaceae bacterium]
MDVVLLLAAFLLSILGIAGSILPLPGIIFSYAGLVCAYLCTYSTLSVETLIIWAVISAVISVIDFVLPIYFTKRLGGSKAGVRGATIGMLLGFFCFPPLGIILCPFFGAVLGEMINDRTNTEKALKVGFGSFVSFLVGTGLKLIASVWMFGLFTMQLIPHVKALIAEFR